MVTEVLSLHLVFLSAVALRKQLLLLISYLSGEEGQLLARYLGGACTQITFADTGKPLPVVLFMVLLEGGRDGDCVVVANLDAVTLVDQVGQP